MGLTVWDTVRGQEALDAIIHLARPKYQYTLPTTKDRAEDVLNKEIMAGHKFVGSVDLSDEKVLLIMER